MKKTKYRKTEIGYIPNTFLTVKQGNFQLAKQYGKIRSALIISAVLGSLAIFLGFITSLLMTFAIIGYVVSLSYILPYLKKKVVYIQYDFTPDQLTYFTFLNGKKSTEIISISDIKQVSFEIYKEDDIMYLEISNRHQTWFDDDLNLQNIHTLVHHIHQLYNLQSYDKSPINQQIKQLQQAKFELYSLPHISESTIEEKFFYRRKKELIIREATHLGNDFKPTTITFKPNFIESKFPFFAYTDFTPPFFFIITITQNQDTLTISIKNFHQVLATFKWNDINKIPQITDALVEIYNLHFFDSKQINDKTEQLFFNSNKGMKSRQLFKVRNNKYELILEFKDFIATKIHFNWLRFLIEKTTKQSKLPQLIYFQDIKQVIFYLHCTKKNIRFNKFALFVVKKDNNTILLTEFDSVIDHQNIGSILPLLFFQAVINVINILKEKSELENIDICLETNDY